MKNNICRECNGEGKPSKCIINNIHYNPTAEPNKVYEDKYTECLKCEKCGHSWIPDYGINILEEISLTKEDKLKQLSIADLKSILDLTSKLPGMDVEKRKEVLKDTSKEFTDRLNNIWKDYETNNNNSI